MRAKYFLLFTFGAYMLNSVNVFADEPKYRYFTYWPHVSKEIKNNKFKQKLCIYDDWSVESSSYPEITENFYPSARFEFQTAFSLSAEGHCDIIAINSIDEEYIKFVSRDFEEIKFE